MQISFYSILIGVLIAVILLMIAATRKNMDQPAAKEVFTAMILVLFALIFFELSLLFTGDIRFTLHELKFVTLVFMPPYTLFIYLAFTGNSRALSFVQKIFLCVIPSATVIFAMTNDFHHFFRKELSVIVHNNVSYVATVSSWWYMVYSVYTYILYFTGIFILCANYIKRPRIYRNQIAFMILTSIAAIALGAASMFKLIPDYGDIGLVSCAVVCMVQYITIVKFSRRMVITKSRNLVIGDIDSLVLILNHKDQLVDANRDAERFYEKLVEVPGASLDGSEIHLPESGEYYSVSDKRMYDEKGMFTGRVVVLNDITGLKTTVNELEHIITHDYLTGLNNRRAFHRRLRELSEKDLPAALISVNVSGMNLINNIFGYEYGDKVIIRLANELNKLTGGNNICSRLNGDEMGVILCNSGESEAASFIETLKSNLMTGGDITLESSYVIMNDTGHDPEQLFAGTAEAIRRDEEQYLSPLSKPFFDSLRNTLTLLRDKSGERYNNISGLCSQVAVALELPKNETDKLLLLAVMADIGLLSVSPAILQNIGNLTNEQWEELKLHTVKGHNIALTILEISGIAKEILAHHERYDGYGYPMRLKADDIPLLSRIYSAVEYFIDSPNASKALTARAGTQFDPNIVDVILKVAT